MKVKDINIKQLYDILVTRVGESKAITVEKILKDHFEINVNADKHATFRQKLQEMMEFYSLPVCSCNRGYFVARNYGDIIRYQESLKARIRGTENRIKLIEELWNESIQKKTKFTHKK